MLSHAFVRFTGDKGIEEQEIFIKKQRKVMYLYRDELMAYNGRSAELSRHIDSCYSGKEEGGANSQG